MPLEDLAQGCVVLFKAEILNLEPLDLVRVGCNSRMGFREEHINLMKLNTFYVMFIFLERTPLDFTSFSK